MGYARLSMRLLGGIPVCDDTLASPCRAVLGCGVMVCYGADVCVMVDPPGVVFCYIL